VTIRVQPSNQDLVALSGIVGVAMLIAHFQIPAHVPGDNSLPATIT
jgi:hypothetical protein